MNEFFMVLFYRKEASWLNVSTKLEISIQQNIKFTSLPNSAFWTIEIPCEFNRPLKNILLYFDIIKTLNGIISQWVMYRLLIYENWFRQVDNRRKILR